MLVELAQTATRQKVNESGAYSIARGFANAHRLRRDTRDQARMRVAAR